MLPTWATEGVKKGEEDELMIEGIAEPLDELIFDGITIEQRRNQLEYVTDERGAFVQETNPLDGTLNPRPRADFELKRYAVNPEGPIRLSALDVSLWKRKEILDQIIAVEVELGLIAPDSKKPKKVKETEMATDAAATKRVKINRTSGKTALPGKANGAEGKAGPGRMPGKLPGKVAMPPKKAEAPNVQASEEEAPAQEAAPAFDAAAFRDTVDQVVCERVQEVRNELLGRLEVLEGKVIDAVTILHDMMVRTGGSMQYPATDADGNAVTDADGDVVYETLPELFDSESKILAYTDGSFAGE
jgi:hypothetical protein